MSDVCDVPAPDGHESTREVCGFRSVKGWGLRTPLGMAAYPTLTGVMCCGVTPSNPNFDILTAWIRMANAAPEDRTDADRVTLGLALKIPDAPAGESKHEWVRDTVCWHLKTRETNLELSWTGKWDKVGRFIDESEGEEGSEFSEHDRAIVKRDHAHPAPKVDAEEAGGGGSDMKAGDVLRLPGVPSGWEVIVDVDYPNEDNYILHLRRTVGGDRDPISVDRSGGVSACDGAWTAEEWEWIHFVVRSMQEIARAAPPVPTVRPELPRGWRWSDDGLSAKINLRDGVVDVHVAGVLFRGERVSHVELDAVREAVVAAGGEG